MNRAEQLGQIYERVLVESHRHKLGNAHVYLYALKQDPWLYGEAAFFFWNSLRMVLRNEPYRRAFSAGDINTISEIIERIQRRSSKLVARITQVLPKKREVAGATLTFNHRFFHMEPIAPYADFQRPGIHMHLLCGEEQTKVGIVVGLYRIIVQSESQKALENLRVILNQDKEDSFNLKVYSFEFQHKKGW